MSIALPSPTVVGPAGPNFVCVTGVVNLFRFIQPPAPGSVIGSLTTPGGGTLPLVQSQPALTGGTTLSAVDGQFATLCGNLTQAQGQLALDVRFVSSGFSPLTPGVDPLTLSLLLLFGLGI